MENVLNAFEIVNSLSDEQIDQLINYSHQDSDILTFTRDPQRFTDRKTTRQFIDNADVYVLLNNDDLAGIIWFSSKSLPDANYTKTFDKGAYNTTFAIRLYGNAKGKGLSFPFMEEVFKQYHRENGITKDIWLQTRADNNRAIHLYQKFGFEQVSHQDNDNRIIMINSV